MNTKINKLLLQFLNSKVLGVICCAIILLIVAIYNKFPLTFNADSAMYIEAAHRRIIEPDRPILYGLFIIYFSFNVSLWIVIIFQSIIVTYTLYLYFYSFAGNYLKQNLINVTNIFFILFALLISTCMGASFQVGWLMADIFTPVSILLLGLIIFDTKINRLNLFFISAILVFSIAMHNSNFLICTALTVITAVLGFYKKIRALYKTSGITYKRLGLAIVLIVVSNLTLSSIHYFYGGEFKSTRGGAIFLMGNVVEMGIIDTYLNDQCGKKKYNLCLYKDSIPNNFLWDKKSPIRKMGGWKGSEAEFSEILRDILTTPKYLKTFIYSSFILTCKQLAVFETGEASLPWRRVILSVRDYHNSDFKSFIRSKQNEGKLNFTLINFIQNIVFAVSLYFYLIMPGLQSVNMKYKLLAFFFLFAIIINAWVCGTFSGVFPRYQSRVVWLLPLPIFLYALEHCKTKFKVRN